MNIALFGQINEDHVCDAFARALNSLGHQVIRIDSGWRGHRFPQNSKERRKIEEALGRVSAQHCEVLFNFRASELIASQVEELRKQGVLTIVWLPDDPVLYGVTYRHVVDAYDFVLNCGPSEILRFYDDRGHAPGVNFPFWLDPARWAYSYEPRQAGAELVFLGNTRGAAKMGRYSALASLAGRLSIYGKVHEDPFGLHRGELVGVEAIVTVIPRYLAGLNIPQRFSDYKGTAYDFPGLSRLGSFILPSRIIQYASVGLPVISLNEFAPGAHFSPTVTVKDTAEVLAWVERFKSRPELAKRLSRQGRAEVENHFSAMARARYLLAMVGGELRPHELSIHEREFGYRWFEGRMVGI